MILNRILKIYLEICELFCIVTKSNGILLSHQKGGILTLCFGVDATGGYYAEQMSQSEKDNYMASFICGI